MSTQASPSFSHDSALVHGVVPLPESSHDQGSGAGPEAFVLIDRSGTTPLAELLHQEDQLYPEECKVGLVIGTFAAVPYVHLQLEARKRYYPTIPVLVHDDGSPKAEEIARLCEQYGADFEKNSPRFTMCKGDMSVFVGGIRWAKQNGIELLLKLSRRFVPMMDWTASLIALAKRSQYATFCAHTTTFNFGFRSECVGMSVKAWGDGWCIDEILAGILRPGTPFVEGFIHNIARRLSARNGAAARTYDQIVGERPHERNGYAPWDYMGTDRGSRSPGFLWHNSSGPSEYHTLACQWGLDYPLEAFNDPNQGFGSSPPAKLPNR